MIDWSIIVYYFSNVYKGTSSFFFTKDEVILIIMTGVITVLVTSVKINGKIWVRRTGLGGYIP